jgi:hypothetical protein
VWTLAGLGPKCGRVWPVLSLVQYSAIQYSTVQHSTAQYSTMQYNVHSHVHGPVQPVVGNWCVTAVYRGLQYACMLCTDDRVQSILYTVHDRPCTVGPVQQALYMTGYVLQGLYNGACTTGPVQQAPYNGSCTTGPVQQVLYIGAGTPGVGSSYCISLGVGGQHQASIALVCSP